MENNELRKIIANKIDKILNESIQNENLDQIMEKFDFKPIEDEISREFKQTNKLLRQTTIYDFNTDFYDYQSIIKNLNSNSTITKLKVLDELLNIPIIDTKQQEWQELSLTLRKCFINANKEIFQRTLRLHYKIITFPNTTNDGYLNLLYGCLLLINSRYFNDSTKTRIPCVVKLILTAHQQVVQQLLHTNYKQIDEITGIFVEIINFRNILDLFGLFDKRANWLKYFCYGSYIRNSFFQQLKKSRIIRIIINEFVDYLNNSTIIKNKHYCYLLLYFLDYRSNFDYFPVQLNEIRTITVENLLELLIKRINQCRDDDLLEILLNLSRNNCVHFTNKFLDLLLENFNGVDSNNLQNFVDNNRHIFVIIKNIAKSTNYRLLFGNCNRVRCRVKSKNIYKKTQINAAQKIIDFVVDILKMGKILDLTTMLDCCYSLYKSHSLSFYYLNSIDLLKELQNLYRMITIIDDKLEVLNLLIYFYSNYRSTIKIIGCDQQILTDLLRFNCNIKQLILSICCYSDKFYYDLLKTVSIGVVKPYLQRIYQLDEMSDGYLLIIDNNLHDNIIIDFLLFIYMMMFDFKAILLFLSDDVDDDRTIIINDDDIFNFKDLIEKCLNYYNQTLDEYLGLMLVKVLINNLDVMVYLKTNYQIQEKLLKLQETSTIDDNLIIDAYSSLRHNILTTIKSVGFVDVNLNEKILEDTELNKFEPFIITTVENGELIEFLQNAYKTNNKDRGWLLQAQRYFKQSLNNFNPTIINLLLQQRPKSYIYRRIELNWPPSDSVYYQLYPEDIVGISTIINFGKLRNLLSLSSDNKQQLTLLIKQSRVFLNYQPEEFNHFDWFVGLIYLICFGDLNMCKNVLINFTQTQMISLLWRTFGYQFDQQLQENFYQQLVIVLEDNCQCYKALQMLEISSDVLVRFWLNQCFFNLLTFEEICNFLAFIILYPPECLLYYIAAIFQHLNLKICTMTHTKTVENMLQMCDMSDFRLGDYLDFIEKLMRQYRNVHRF